MFSAIVTNGELIDLVALDGRLTTEDLEFISLCVHSDTIFVLDDFEGMEKGVINLLNLCRKLRREDYQLIYPPTITNLSISNSQGRCTTAVYLPKKLICYVAQ